MKEKGFYYKTVNFSLKEVYFNGSCIGRFELDVDGYYGYIPDNSGGYFTSFALKGIANLLDKVNKPYDDYVKANL